MSIKDTNNQNAQESNFEINTSMKDNMHLFSFSLLKSKEKHTLSSQYNSFKLDFSKENTEPNYAKKKYELKSVKNRRISLIDDDNISSLKTLNIEVPSSERLTNEKFKKDFLKEYEKSFAHYCGISRDQYIDIYIKNRYTPIINEFGDIHISIKHIVDLLKTYSINVNDSRKLIKHRFKRFFKTYRNNKIINKRNRFKKKVIFEIMTRPFDDDTLINDYRNNENKTIKKIEEANDIPSLITINKNNDNNNNHYSDSSINKIKNKVIQKYGPLNIQNNQKYKNPIYTSSRGIGIMSKSNINMPSNSFLFSTNNLTNGINKKQITNNMNNNNSLGLGYSAIQKIQDNRQNMVSPTNNNFFNFSNQNIKYVSSTNNNNTNNNILTTNANNINFNPQMNNQLLSPPPFTISSPIMCMNEMFSPYSPYSNLQTPRIISPNFNNNIFQDRFTYNNINGNSFFIGSNSPITINNNNININNNIINNNINNNTNNCNGNVIMNNNNIIDNKINNNRNLIDKNNNNIQNNNMQKNNNNNFNFIRKNLKNNLKVDLNLNK